jgi:histidine ammonia-lyase
MKSVSSVPPVIIDGSSLTLQSVVQVARAGARVELAASSHDRIRRARETLDQAIARGDRIYGVTTGVGAHKSVRVEPTETARFQALMLASHFVGHGPPFEHDVVRAALLRLVNGFAIGVSGVSLEFVRDLIEALNDDRHAAMRQLGSVGQADLAPLGDLAVSILGDAPLAAKEAVAFLCNNSVSTACAALAVSDCRRLLQTLDVAAALDMEAFRANLSILHPAIASVRPRPSLAQTISRFRSLLADSDLWLDGAARNLQDPLSFRTVAELHAAARDAIDFAERQVVIELNASQENPIVLSDEGKLISVANFEVAAMAAALDFLRIGLAPVLTSACERIAKLLHRGFSGLAGGLSADPHSPEDALSEYAVVAAAVASEARLLAQPVSFDVATSSIAEGVEDRVTMAPLAARRVAEMVALGEQLVANELVVAAQATDLRSTTGLGVGPRRAHALVRGLVPRTSRGDPPPSDLRSLVAMIRSGRLAATGDSPLER